jgi:hypothetical protein
VIDEFGDDVPLTEVNTLTYIPLLVLKEDMDRWPLEDSSTKVRNIANQASRPLQPS